MNERQSSSTTNKKNIRFIHTNSFSVDEDVIVEKRHRFAGWFILSLSGFVKCLNKKKNKKESDKKQNFQYAHTILAY